MPLMKRLKFLMLAVFAASFMTAAPLHAAPQPDPSSNPVLAQIMKMGGKMFYLGSHSGMDGWFIIKDGQVQIAYSLPDKKGIMIGGMFDENGNSVTSEQMKNLIMTNKEVAGLMSSAMKEQAAIGANDQPPAAQNASTGTGTGSLPSVALSPGEQLLQQLSAAPGVTVGNSKAQLFMVMDPNCPHCQATWRALKPAVQQGALEIRMIPIGAVNSDNERAAAVFMHVSDPLTIWDKYVNGDKSQLAGAPDPAMLAAVRANHLLIDSWHIPVTPYMAYRAKDGKVKIVQGELDKPEKVNGLLSDLGS